MAAGSRDSQNKIIQRKLQAVVLRAAVGGYIIPIESAIHVCVTQFNEGKSNPKDILDAFPEDLDVKVQKKYHCHSPLMIACEDDRDDIVDVLLKNEATVALKNKYGLTAVHIVCRKGKLNILKMLLEKAKDQRVCFSKKSKPPLPSDCEAVLLTRPKKGWYPVMYAVKEGHVELVKECFDKVEHAITTKKKQTVLHIAARAGQLDCLKEIVPKVSDDLKTGTDKNGWNVLHHTCASGNLEVLKWLMDSMKDICTDMLKQKCKCNHTPLLTACEYKKEEIVQYLLSLPDVNTSYQSDTEGTDPESQQERERTALHIAAAHNSLNIVKLLIEKEHPLTIRDKNGDTALHYAYRSSSTDVVDLLEQHVPEIKNIKNDNGELPNEVKLKDVIPLEISRRGEDAIEIYKRVLKKGKMKIPRCSLLILGEEHVGKTSLYRLLVNKGFDPKQESTRGIDDNEVDIVDERSVAMGDDWEEKPKENQEEQIKKTYIDGMSETLHAELPPPPEKIKKVYQPEPVLSKDELMIALESIKKEIEIIPKDKEPKQSVVKGRSLQSQAVHEEHNVPPRKPKHPPTAASRDPQSKHHTQPHRPSSDNRGEHQHRPKTQDVTQDVHEDIDTSPSQTISSESVEATVSNTELPSEEPREVAALSISRQERQIIDKKLKAKKKLVKDKAKEPTQLELRALDFAGQKQYRPMHHCFITRRAMYLVVFNLQKMIEYIEEEQVITSNTVARDDLIPFSPIEQLRYWLYSIHAHVFPPKEGDNMRRVCLVGTHRSPPGERHISDDDIKKINKRLTCEFEDDDRCTNLFHYMGSSKPKLIFAPVENSIAGKEHNDRVKSGAVDLQKELKLISRQLKFLDEDHPLIWLRFEQELIKMRQNLIQKKLPLFVTVDEVLKLAESQGMDDAESKDLALKFFHDTGKLVLLKRVPTLYLSVEEQEELAELIILDPAWLSRVMRAVVEIDASDILGNRKPVMRLNKEGIASKELLMDIWDEFLPGTDDRDQSFHHLCTILKAYCLIYPLKDSSMPNSEDKNEEPPSPIVSSSSESSERQSVTNNDFFLIPCMLPESVKRKKDSHFKYWITFYFDFEKFLPEVLYHRFVCQLLAAVADRRKSPKCSKIWSQFNICGCIWKIEPLRDAHMLKISVLTKDTSNLSQHIVNIHKNYLRQICAESEFRGLKYHGGPIAKCECKEEGVLRILHCVSFSMETDECTASEESYNTVVDCDECLTSQNVEELLQYQVRNWSVDPNSVQSPLVTSSDDIKAPPVLDKSTEPPTLSQAFRKLISLSDRWQNIGLLLGLDDDSLRRIDAEHRGVPDNCLREMLSLWLKQVDPPPTRKALTEAVEVYDPALAQKID